MKARGPKPQFSNFSLNWGIFGNTILAFQKSQFLISFFNYTALEQHFKVSMLNLWMSWQKLYPNLSFTVKNKMENSHKRGSSHFKLKIND